MSDEKQRRTGAIWWGAILVVAGLVLLASQFIPGISLWRYWPLIIVALGVREAFGPSRAGWKPRHLTSALVTVVIGGILLAQMLGYLDWSAWVNVLRLWPLLLVSIGVQIAGKAIDNEWLRAAGSVVIAAGLIYAVLGMSASGTWPIISGTPGELTPFSYTSPHTSGIRAGSAEIEGGVGTFTLKAGDALATADGKSPLTPSFEAETASGKAVVRIVPGESGVNISWPAGARTDVTLDRALEWDLDVKAGVTTYDVDLRDLRISRLWLESGVSHGTLTLGKAADSDDGPVVADIEVGVSSVTIKVPAGDSVRVSISEGLTDFKARGDWETRKEGSVRIHESAAFSSAGAYWDIRVNAGIGSITVEYY